MDSPQTDLEALKLAAEARKLEIEKLDPNEQVFFKYPLNEEKFPWEIRFSFRNNNYSEPYYLGGMVCADYLELPPIRLLRVVVGLGLRSYDCFGGPTALAKHQARGAQGFFCMRFDL